MHRGCLVHARGAASQGEFPVERRGTADATNMRKMRWRAAGRRGGTSRGGNWGFPRLVVETLSMLHPEAKPEWNQRGGNVIYGRGPARTGYVPGLRPPNSSHIQAANRLVPGRRSGSAAERPVQDAGSRARFRGCIKPQVCRRPKAQQPAAWPAQCESHDAVVQEDRGQVPRMASPSWPHFGCMEPAPSGAPPRKNQRQPREKLVTAKAQRTHSRSVPRQPCPSARAPSTRTKVRPQPCGPAPR